MQQQSDSSSSFKDASHLARTRAAPEVIVPPDGVAARDARGHFTQAFRVAALRYALTCGKTRKQAAADMGISERSLTDWNKDACPSDTGEFDVERFDELAQLRAEKRDLLARNLRLTQERDFLKKVSAYFAAPTRSNGGSK